MANIDDEVKSFRGDTADKQESNFLNFEHPNRHWTQTLKVCKSVMFFSIYQLLKKMRTSVLVSRIYFFFLFVHTVGVLFSEEIDFDLDSNYAIKDFRMMSEWFRLLPYLSGSISYIYWCTILMTIAIPLFCTGVFVYIHYKNGKALFWLPISIAQTLCSTYNWILFLPILEVQLGIFNCDGSSHKYINDIPCWKEEHIILIIFTLFSMLFSFVFSFLLSVFYFESRKKVSDFLGRSPCYIEFMVNLYKAFLALNLVFTIEKFVILGVCIAFVGILLLRVTTFNPFYSREISKIFFSILTLNLWSLVCLTIAGFVGRTETQHFSLILAAGTPFVLYMSIMYERNKKMSTLSESRRQFKSDLDYYFQIEYLIQLTSEQYFCTKKKKFIIGILQDHRDECMDDQCPCSRNEGMYDILTDSFHEPKHKKNEDLLFLKYLIRKLFEDALFQHENSEYLHLSYAMFLFDFMRNRHMAFYQLSLIDKSKPSLPMQFAVFRERKVLDEDIQKQHLHRSGKRRLTNTVDITQVLKFDRYCLDFQSTIEKTTIAYIDFWNRLGEVRPEIKKLDPCGTKLEERLQELNNLWTKMNKINPNSVKLLTLYARFLVQVKNCDQEGTELLSKIRYLKSKQTVSSDNEAEFLFAEDCAMITISVLHEQLSKIVSVSKSVVQQYGYSQPEIVGHSVTLLMPTTIGRVHDSFIMNFINTGQEKIINRIRNLYAIHRQGYAFPVKIVVKPLPSVEEDVKYVGFTRPTETRDQIILVDQRGIIDSISYDLTMQLRLQLNFFKNNFVSLKYFVPDLLQKDIDQGNNFFSVNWTPDSVFDLTLTLPKEFQSKIKNCEDEINKFLTSIGFSSNESQLSGNMNGFNSFNRANFFQELTEFLENAEREDAAEIKEECKKLLQTLSEKMDFSEPADTFSYRCKAVFINLPGCQLHALHLSQKASEVGSTIHPDDDEDRDERFGKSNLGLLQRVEKNPGMEHFYSSPEGRERGPRNFGGESEDRNFLRDQLNGDPTTKRDPFEDLVQAGKDKEPRRSADKESIISGTDNKKLLNIVKRSILDTKNIPGVIRWLNFSSQAVFILSVVIATALFTTQIILYSQVNEMVDVMNRNTYLQQYTIQIGIKVRLMDLVNNNYYATNQDENSSPAKLQNSLRDIVQNLKSDQETLVGWNFDNDPEGEYFENEDVGLKYRSYNDELSDYTYNLNTVMLQITSQAYEVGAGNASDVKEADNEAVYFLLFNCFNDVYVALKKTSENFISEIIDKEERGAEIINWFLLGTGLMAFLGGLYIFLILSRVYGQRRVIMDLFLKISIDKYLQLSSNCTEYLNFIQGVEAQDENELTQKKDEKKSKSKNHRRSFKGSAGTDFKVYLFLALYILLASAYFALLFIINQSFSSDLKTLLDETEIFEQMLPLQSLLFFAHIDMLATNGESTIEGIKSSLRASQLTEEYDNLLQRYSKLSLESSSLHTSSYSDLYNNLEFGNTCLYLDLTENELDECTELDSGLLTNGLKTATTRYMEYLKNIHTDYMNSDKSEETLEEFLEEPNLKVAQLLEDIYFFKAYRKLTEQLLDVIKVRFDDEIYLSIYALVSYLSAMIIYYLAFWRRTLKKMRYLLWKTKSWLGMLPIDLIQNTADIHSYLLSRKGKNLS